MRSIASSHINLPFLASFYVLPVSYSIDTMRVTAAETVLLSHLLPSGPDIYATLRQLAANNSNSQVTRWRFMQPQLFVTGVVVPLCPSFFYFESTSQPGLGRGKVSIGEVRTDIVSTE